MWAPLFFLDKPQKVPTAFSDFRTEAANTTREMAWNFHKPVYLEIGLIQLWFHMIATSEIMEDQRKLLALKFFQKQDKL